MVIRLAHYITFHFVTAGLPAAGRDDKVWWFLIVIPVFVKQNTGIYRFIRVPLDYISAVLNANAWDT